MVKKVICFALGALVLVLSLPAEAQQLKKVFCIGILTSVDPASEFIRFKAIRQARLFDQTLRTK